MDMVIMLYQEWSYEIDHNYMVLGPKKSNIDDIEVNFGEESNFIFTGKWKITSQITRPTL